jgi:hypothetical protein
MPRSKAQLRRSFDLLVSMYAAKLTAEERVEDVRRLRREAAALFEESVALRAQSEQIRLRYGAGRPG